MQGGGPGLKHHTRHPKDGQTVLGCTHVLSPISGELARSRSVTVTFLYIPDPEAF